MGKASRDKGRRGEQEVARIFRAAGFEVDRVPNSGGLKVKGDLTGLENYHVEVKRQEKAAIWAWLRQADDERGEHQIPVVIFRRSHEEWQACLPLEHFVELIEGQA